jgi:hypothetical protein
MAETKYTAQDSPETLLSTELNSLGSGSNKVTSSAVSNDAAAERKLFADFELYLNTAGSARDNDAYVSMYFLIEVDGTNYTFGGDSTDPPASAWVGNFMLDATGVTTARYSHLRQIPLPACDFKVLLINNTGQSFNASGNTLKMSRYGVQSV